MFSKEILAKRLKQLRIDNNLSTRDLGSILNTSCSQISKYENSKHIPTAVMIFNYAKYFNVSSDYLLGLSDNRVIL
jgi:transcriptional regulator with XRE-family HTH domain